MAANTGITTVNGTSYIPRPQYFPQIINVTSDGQVLMQQRVALPGNWLFRLKALTRLTLVSNAPSVRNFLFKLGSSDGPTIYTGGQVQGNSTGAVSPGGSIDRVLDTLIFGDGRFPFVLSPDVLYSPNAQINYEIEDVSNDAPYTIYLNFIGEYLIPA